MLHLIRWVVLIVLSVIFLSQPVMNTDAAGQFIQQKINEMVPGTISFSNHSISLFTREISLRKPHIQDEAGATVFYAESLRIRFRFFNFLSRGLLFNEIFLEEPALHLSYDTDGALNLNTALGIEPEEDTVQDEADEAGFHLLIRKAKIVDGTFSFDNPGEYGVTIERISADMYIHTRHHDYSGDIRMEKGAYWDEDNHFTGDTLRLNADIVEGDIHSVDFAFMDNESSLFLNGSMYDVFSPEVPSGDITLKADVDKAFLDRFFDNTFVAQLTGTMKYSGPLTDPAVDITAEARGTSDQNQLFQDARVAGGITDSVFHVDTMGIQLLESISLRSAGTVQLHTLFTDDLFASGDIPSADTVSWQMEGRVEDRAEYPVTNDLDINKIFADYRFSGRGFALDVLQTDFSIAGGFSLSNTTTDSTDVILDVDGSYARDVVMITESRMDFDPGVLKTSGTVDLQNSMLELQNSFDGFLLEHHGAFFEGFPAIQGQISGDIDLDGSVRYPSVSGSISARNVGYGNYGADQVQGDISHDARKGISTLSVEASKDSSSLSADLSGRFFRAQSYALRPAFLMEGAVDGEVYLGDISNDTFKGYVAFDGRYQGEGLDGTGEFMMQSSHIEHALFDLYDIELPLTMKEGVISAESALFNPDSSGVVHVNGEVRDYETLDMAFSSQDLILDKISLLADYDLGGRADLTLRVDSTFAAPELTLESEIEDFYYGEMYSHEGPFSLAGGFRDDSLTFDVEGPFSLEGGYSLGGNYELAAYTDTLNIDDILSTLYDDMPLWGDFTGKITLTGKDNTMESLRADVGTLALAAGTRDNFSGRYFADIHNQHLTYDGEKWNFPDVKIRLDEGPVMAASGSISRHGDLALDISGDFPLSLAYQFPLDEVDSLSGNIGVDMAIGNTIEEPSVSGTLSGRSLEFFVPQTNQRIHSLDIDITFSDTQTVIPSIHGRIGRNGTFSVTGQAGYKALSLVSGQYAIKGRNIALEFPGSSEFVLDVNSRLQFSSDGMSLDGSLDLLEGYYYKDIDLAGTDFSDDVEYQADALEESSSGIVDINLRVVPRRNLYVDNNLAFLEIRPDITLTGTERSLSAEGQADIVSGDISYYNRTFSVTNGVVYFLDPRRLEMDVDVTGVSYVRDYTITLSVTGNPDEELDVSLIGRKSGGETISDMDVVSLLLTGYTTNELQSDEVGMREALIRQIQNVVASMDNPYMGIDDFQVDFDSERGGTEVSLSDELTRRLSTQIDFDIAEGEAYTRARFILKLFENVSVSSFTDTEGHSGGKLQFEIKGR
ncbi:MAG: translocation/assembly module TamB domain-containing protein [Fibrobacterota bacterium]